MVKFWLEYNIAGQTYSNRMEYGTNVLPGNAENMTIVCEKEVTYLDDDSALPQPKKAKAQYEKMNDWRNRRKR